MDLYNKELPKCILNDHNKAILNCLKGNNREFLDRWVAACNTLNLLAIAIKQIDPNFSHNVLPDLKVKELIEVELNKGNKQKSYDHWLAAGSTVDSYNTLLQHLSKQKPSQNIGDNEEKPTEISDKKINFFLWKPVAEGGAAQFQGRPVLLSRGSEEVGFMVNGKKGARKGPNNGYQSCDMTTVYGKDLPKNTRVDFYDRETKLPVKFGDKTYIIIPNPTHRYECNPTKIKEIIPTE